ncbi:YlbF family regulator [uncultured Ruminococcus sp.]|uniref:YlbF family regulator n=1 Tax=uncultured Ruminococcus sp. TaxID=165186 RepID=UPI0025F083AA|nr:YlbF family regulator [uncultured Ruminococcus sp.]
MMNVIELTRQLGKAIQEDERYKKYEEAAKFNDTDIEIQNSIGRFNQLRSELGVEMRKPDKDADRLTSLDSEIKELYDEIMAMPKMVAFNEAKADIDALMKSVYYILQQAANGEDPETCPAQAPSGCSGSCASCGGGG